MDTPALPRLPFDRIAEVFDDQRALPPDAIAALQRAFAELVDAGLASLVEPGAGTGRIAIPALAAGLRVTALDVSVPMLDTLSARLRRLPEVADRCDVVHGDATALPFDDDRFDTGLLAQVLYLIPAWEQALDELVRVVRPAGRVMLLQERTWMSPELDRWDVAWRDSTEQSGHVPVPQVPDDDVSVAALAERTNQVAERELVSWEFGQKVDDALAGLDRMRPLYEALPDAAWTSVVAGFRRWQATSGLAGDSWLGGTVTLTLVTGVVPACS